MFMVFLKNICNIKHVKQDLQKYSIFLNDSNHDYILEETEHRDTFYLEIDLRDDGDEEYFLLVLSYFFFIHRTVIYNFFLNMYMHVTSVIIL